MVVEVRLRESEQVTLQDRSVFIKDDTVCIGYRICFEYGIVLFRHRFGNPIHDMQHRSCSVSIPLGIVIRVQVLQVPQNDDILYRCNGTALLDRLLP